ncbi:MAG TPA: DNA alkylation repair protein [Phycisphaerales bacterium]|nr:DNA alkylation repair protein [Phycisphaerales bacterium]
MNTRDALALIEQHADPKVAAGLDRFGITTGLRVLGMSIPTMRKLAKQIGQDHALAQKLWDSGVYEAQFIACFIADPAALTVKQMDGWTKSFDNWATCDTACFCLYDRSPLAWGRIEPWAKSRHEFVKRAAFATLAGLAGHDKWASDEQFLAFLPLIERCADDDRNFVKKGVSWALRAMGVRRPSLRPACTELAQRLAASDNPTTRWIGKDALGDFAKANARKRSKLTRTSP